MPQSLTLPPWNYKNKHVESGIKPNQFVGAQNCLLCAGPAALESGDGSFNLQTIGVVENVMINQAKALQRIYEVGSSLPYIVPGQVSVALQLSRIFIYGMSLLGRLYQTYLDMDDEDNPRPYIDDIEQAYPDPASPPNSGQLYANLQSDFFSQPIGILFWFMDNQPQNADTPGHTVGVMYSEHTFVSSHQFQINSGAVIIMESSALEARRLFPVDLQSIEVPV